VTRCRTHENAEELLQAAGRALARIEELEQYVSARDSDPGPVTESPETFKTKESLREVFAKIEPPVDFTIADHGTIVLLRSNTEAAEEWAAEHLPSDAQHFGGGVAVEPRYVADILTGIQKAGLSIDSDWGPVRPIAGLS
jgi:hypothetical protein